MSYVSQDLKSSSSKLHRIGFDVDPITFASLKVIPHGFRTKLLRELINAVVNQAETDGNEVYHKIINGDFTLSLGTDE